MAHGRAELRVGPGLAQCAVEVPLGALHARREVGEQERTPHIVGSPLVPSLRGDLFVVRVGRCGNPMTPHDVDRADHEEQADETEEPDCGVFWLPFFHDMGLIGGILEPLYVAGRSVLMSPRSFLQRPLRWLQSISDYKASISGAHVIGRYLPALFEPFTAATGIRVTVRHRREEQIVAEVIENSGSPPADVLLARSVHGIWQAADEGALRPLQSPQSTEAVAEWLRDPDGYWAATGYTPIGIAIDPGSVDVAAISDYGDLGLPQNVRIAVDVESGGR